MHIELVGPEHSDYLCAQRDLELLELGGLDHVLGRIAVNLLERVLEPEPVPVTSVPYRDIVLRPNVIIGDSVRGSLVDFGLVQPEHEGVEVYHLSVLVVILREGSLEVSPYGSPVFEFDLENYVGLPYDSGPENQAAVHSRVEDQVGIEFDSHDSLH